MPRAAKSKPTARPTAPPVAVAPALTLAFHGTEALLAIDPPQRVATVACDGARIDPAEWSVADDGRLRVACSPAVFDGTPHTLTLSWDAAALPPAAVSFCSRYRGYIDIADEHSIAGWLFDELRPASPLTLELRAGGQTLRVVCNLHRADLRDMDGAIVGGGFHAALPRRAADAAPELVSFTLRGTNVAPFPPVLRGATLPAMVAAAVAGAQALGRTPAGLLFGGLLLPPLLQALNGTGRGPDRNAPRGALPLAGGTPGAAPPEIDVIVPVYRGLAETLDCIASLLGEGGGAAGRIAHRIIVIDDCAPEPELSTALAALGAAGRITYLRNDRNIGFVASVNRGMAQSASADVLLLNADTLAPPGFLDRLYRAAHADAAIATVTPLSNNATIYSLPAAPGGAGDPWEMTTAEIDALCQAANPGVLRDIPTAHGFCMYIKRAALDDVGLFDAVRFGTGYGEENDFSLRALARGWRNVCAADVYVTHLGSVSFSTVADWKQQMAANLRAVQALYPYYDAFVADFIRTDPLHDLRNAVQKRVWSRHRRAAVFVTLALEGGAVRHAEDMMAHLAAEDWLVLALAAAVNDDGQRTLVLRRGGLADTAPAEALHYPVGTPLAEALADILDIAPRFIHVQHLIDLPDGIGEFVRDSGIPYAVTLHDFFYACPKVTLLDAGARYCGMPPAAKCTTCVRHGPIHPQINPELTGYAERGEVWRGKWEMLLREAMQVIAPSQDTADRYAQLFPGLAAVVRPHVAPHHTAATARRRPPPGARLRVAIPGAIGPQKGAQQLVELVRHCSLWHDDIDFVVVGYTDRTEELTRFDTVQVLGGYRPEAAVAALAAAGCHVALLLAVFPETFSYTLSESLEAGLVPVAYDFGAIGERIRALGHGVTVPLLAPPDAIVAALRRAAAQPAPAPGLPLYGSYRRMMGDYYVPALADLAAAIPPPDLPRLLLRPAGLHDDAWCDSAVTLHLWSARPLARVALNLWLPEAGRHQAVEITTNAVRLVRRFLEPGAAERIVLTLPEGTGPRLDLVCRFDFVFRLAAPDVRACAAMLSGVQVSDGRGWLPLDLPGTAPLRRDAAA